MRWLLFLLGPGHACRCDLPVATFVKQGVIQVLLCHGMISMSTLRLIVLGAKDVPEKVDTDLAVRTAPRGADCGFSARCP